jgi:hypothetical protein
MAEPLIFISKWKVKEGKLEDVVRLCAGRVGVCAGSPVHRPVRIGRPSLRPRRQ